ncbi:MAG TPA: VOC family protein [Beijerinckiaceae bacterium]|jgi:catechol 2,3-dioxygenase-like lactoylglutathione lyase family enzyme
MPLTHIVGLDHVVILVRDLDRAAETWRRLGFTLAPRGTHSAHMGTANHTIMLGPDYLELIGVVAEKPYNEPSRALLERRGEGIERAALATDDAAAGVEEIRARGLAGNGPLDFGRPVTLPDGTATEARFRVFQWPLDEAPAGLRIFACQHLTRDAVWIPALQRHVNGAQRIERVEIVSADPQKDAAHMARLLDEPVRRDPDGALRVAPGGGRAAFVFLTREALARRYPGVPLEGLPPGPASLVLATDDLDAAARALGPTAVRSGKSVCVPPAAANGVLLAFEKG